MHKSYIQDKILTEEEISKYPLKVMSYDSTGNKTRHLTRVEKCEYFLLERSIKRKHLDSRVVKF
jgi:hypothetical protein